jgi:hypothetical protein
MQVWNIFINIGAIFLINVREYSVHGAYRVCYSMFIVVFHGFPPLRPKIWFCQWESPSAAESHQPTA